jgi:hypothetical protein
MAELLGPGLIVGLLLFWLVMIAAFILLFVFWIYMLVDVAQRKFKHENDKVIWVIIVALLNWLGALIYYFAIKRRNKH